MIHCGYRRYSLNQGKHQQCTGGKWGGGLLSLVNTCGEIGVCPPCTEAHPLQRVGPLWVVGGGPPAKGGAFQLLEYQMVWWVCRFDTLGKLVSAHRAQRPTLCRVGPLWVVGGGPPHLPPPCIVGIQLEHPYLKRFSSLKV